MSIRSSVFVIAVCLTSALTAGCAGGGSSATRDGSLPSTAQQGSGASVPTATGRGVHSGVRRTSAVPTCSLKGGFAFVGGSGSSPGANVAGGAYSVVGGGQYNQACDQWSVIAGGYTNAVSGQNSTNTDDGFIGGGEFNTLTGNDTDSAIVSGNQNVATKSEAGIVAGDTNSVGALASFIGTGSANAINQGGAYAAIASGLQNTLSGEYAFIGAGLNNTVSGEGGYIAAGGYNTVSGTGAVIDGGFNSTATGSFATVPGGYVNSAAGTYSLAAGARASAAQTGTFVWSDGSDGDTILTSARAYQFLARASGGVTFYTNAASTVGAQLAPGSGTWSSASDRNLKTDVSRIDDAAVLDKVAALPIARWSYKSERGVRHVGPMAQDFYAAFKVGEDDKHITSVDEDGVALAAIKALHARVGTLTAENARLRAASASQSATIGAMQVQLSRLSAQMDSLTGR